MSFLMPFFLWLLPLTAVPLVIHLLNRMNIITIDFSTLRFLKMLEKESIRKLKILQIILLILRTIIILLIVFMITRPVLTGAFSLHNSGNSALHAIVLDDSFSIQGNFDIIKKTAARILMQIPDKGQLIWLNFNKGLQYKGLKEDMPPIDNLLKFTHLAGSVKDGLNILKENIDNEYTSKEIYILTDSQHESMKDLWEHSDQYEDMHLYIMVAPQLTDNLAITNVELKNEILLPNHAIELEVSIKNTGQTIKDNIFLQLVIDNMSVGQQMISLPVNKKQSFYFTTALPSTGTHRAMMVLDSDERATDNRYFFSLYIPDQRNIAFIRNSQEETYYIHESLKALNKSGELINISEFITLDDPNLRLENQDAVFILSPDILLNVKDSKMEEYLYNGGHLIIFSGVNSKPADYSFVNTITPNIIGGNYKNLTFSEGLDDSFQDVDFSSIQISDIHKLFSSVDGQDRNIRIFKYFTLPYEPAYSQLLLNDGSSIWNRYNIHRGIIDVFGFAMNLNWTNFPIKGTFLPFIHFIAYAQSGGKENFSKTIGSNWEVIPDDYYSGNIFHVLPNGSRNIITADENNHLITDLLEHTGYHSIETEGVKISQIAVNIDQTELYCNYSSIEVLQDKMPDNMQIIPMGSDIIKVIKQARIGIEIWRYILYLAIILLMIEMLISNVKRQN